MRILIVEDLGLPAEIATAELKKALDCEVDRAATPHEGIARLLHTSYDIALVDMLFRDHTSEFIERLRARKVKLADPVLHQSGLAILHTIRERKLNTRPVLWTSGDANRYLHMMFAYEELNCKVFCTKDNVRTLHEAVRSALEGKEYRDSILQLNRTGRHSKSLRETILSSSAKLAIWRTMALGYHKHSDIERVLSKAKGSVRKEVGDMRETLQALNPQYLIEGNPTPALVMYASQNWEFFLDDTVRTMYS